VGTDYLELFDRRTAEIIVSGAEADLISLVEARTPPNSGPPVWHHFWNASLGSLQEFPRTATSEDRFHLIRSASESLDEIKGELMEAMCVSRPLFLDYWGCMAEVFRGGEPPGAVTWEEFAAPLQSGNEPVESSGRYLLTPENTEAILQSLRTHVRELRVTDSQVLRSWSGGMSSACVIRISALFIRSISKRTGLPRLLQEQDSPEQSAAGGRHGSLMYLMGAQQHDGGVIWQTTGYLHELKRLCADYALEPVEIAPIGEDEYYARCAGELPGDGESKDNRDGG
jgi:hypothetical protein